MAGVCFGWAVQQLYPGNDYWALHRYGVEENELLFKNPRLFFTSLFQSPYDHFGGFFDAIGSYWNYLRYNFIIKLLAIANIFSRGNFYINTLLLNAVVFPGFIALYRVFIHIYPSKKWPVIIGSFLLPSTLLYTSVVNKDLIVLFLIGLFTYAIYFNLFNKATIKRWLILLISFAGLLLMRNYVALAFIPALISLRISLNKKKQLLIFIGCYCGIVLMALLLQYFIPAFQPLQMITQRQADFSEIPIANTQLTMPVLKPNLLSFITNLPVAFNHGFLRPFIWESSGISLLPFAIELFTYQILFVMLLTFSIKSAGKIHPFILMLLVLSLSLIIVTGYIVPNTSSIIRYRSNYLPLIITPLICSLVKRQSVKTY